MFDILQLPIIEIIFYNTFYQKSIYYYLIIDRELIAFKDIVINIFLCVTQSRKEIK